MSSGGGRSYQIPMAAWRLRAWPHQQLKQISHEISKICDRSLSMIFAEAEAWFLILFCQVKWCSPPHYLWAQCAPVCHKGGWVCCRPNNIPFLCPLDLLCYSGSVFLWVIVKRQGTFHQCDTPIFQFYFYSRPTQNQFLNCCSLYCL